jgi:hypothetical protein
MGALVAAPVTAAPVVLKGLDFWYTPAGGAQVNASIPAGLFCNGNSGPFNTVIALKGSPLVTGPAGVVSPADTVVDRPSDISFNGGLTATGSLHIRALDLVGETSFSVDCSQWTSGNIVEVYSVRVHLDGTPQSLGTITIRRAAVTDNGGEFDAQFPVDAFVRFKNQATGQNLPPVADSVTITTLDACWSHTAGAGSIAYRGSLGLDTNGTRAVNYTSPYASSNFFAGIDKFGLPCPVEHVGPHPVTCSDPGSQACPEDPKTNPCDARTRQLLAQAAVSGGFDFSSIEADAEASGDDLAVVRAQRCVDFEGAQILQDAEQPVDAQEQPVGTEL